MTMARLSSVSRPTSHLPLAARQRCRLPPAAPILLVGVDRGRWMRSVTVPEPPACPSGSFLVYLARGIRCGVGRKGRTGLPVQRERGIDAGDGAFRRGDLDELHPRREIAGGVDARHRGLAVAVDGDVAVLVETAAEAAVQLAVRLVRDRKEQQRHGGGSTVLNPDTGEHATPTEQAFRR